MKRLLYLSSALLVIVSFMITGGRSFAAHQAASMPIVRICASAPVGVPALKGLSSGIFNGVILATQQWMPKFRRAGYLLQNPMVMDDAKSDGSTYGTDQERQNALNCINAKNTYGYVGTLNTGAALVSEPLTNQAHMVQISPANTGTVLTDPMQRAAQEPATYKHQIPTVTYFRTVTTDALQGPAGAAFAHQRLGAKTYFLIDDKLAYGAGLAAAYDAYAQRIGMKKVGTGHINVNSEAESTDAIADQVVSAKPDVVYCGCDSETSNALPKKLRSRGYTKPFTGGDALFNQSWITDTGSGSVNNYVTSVGPDPTATTGAFRSAYQRRFHVALEAYDATSYDAANIILNALYKVITSHQMKGTLMHRRTLVVQRVAREHWKGATGWISFDANGDTTNKVVSVYKTSGHTWQYVGPAPVPAGIKPTG